MDGRFHVVMTGTAELVAGELKVPGAGGLKPDPSYRAARHAILVEAEFRNIERMDDITRMKQNMDGTTDRHHQIGGDNILRRAGI